MSVIELGAIARPLASCGPDGDVETQGYIDLYKGINAFLGPLGTVSLYLSSSPWAILCNPPDHFVSVFLFFFFFLVWFWFGLVHKI